MTATQGEPGLSDTEGAPAAAAAASLTEQSVSDSESPGPRRGSDSDSGSSDMPVMMPSQEKKMSRLGRWDGKFSRPTFFEAGGTDLPPSHLQSFCPLRARCQWDGFSCGAFMTPVSTASEKAYELKSILVPTVTLAVRKGPHLPVSRFCTTARQCLHLAASSSG